MKLLFILAIFIVSLPKSQQMTNCFDLFDRKFILAALGHLQENKQEFAKGFLGCIHTKESCKLETDTTITAIDPTLTREKRSASSHHSHGENHWESQDKCEMDLPTVIHSVLDDQIPAVVRESLREKLQMDPIEFFSSFSPASETEQFRCLVLNICPMVSFEDIQQCINQSLAVLCGKPSPSMKDVFESFIEESKRFALQYFGEEANSCIQMMSMYTGKMLDMVGEEIQAQMSECGGDNTELSAMDIVMKIVEDLESRGVPCPDYGSILSCGKKEIDMVIEENIEYIGECFNSKNCPLTEVASAKVGIRRKKRESPPYPDMESEEAFNCAESLKTVLEMSKELGMNPVEYLPGSLKSLLCHIKNNCEGNAGNLYECAIPPEDVQDQIFGHISNGMKACAVRAGMNICEKMEDLEMGQEHIRGCLGSADRVQQLFQVFTDAVPGLCDEGTA